MRIIDLVNIHFKHLHLAVANCTSIFSGLLINFYCSYSNKFKIQGKFQLQILHKHFPYILLITSHVKIIYGYGWEHVQTDGLAQAKNIHICSWKNIKMEIFVCNKWLILEIKFIIYERKMYFHFCCIFSRSLRPSLTISVSVLNIYILSKMQ